MQISYLCPALAISYLGAKHDFEIWAFKVFAFRMEGQGELSFLLLLILLLGVGTFYFCLCLSPCINKWTFKVKSVILILKLQENQTFQRFKKYINSHFMRKFFNQVYFYCGRHL